MRRLVIEFSGKELQKTFEKVKSLEMLDILKMAPGDLAAIMKVEFQIHLQRLKNSFQPISERLKPSFCIRKEKSALTL